MDEPREIKAPYFIEGPTRREPNDFRIRLEEDTPEESSPKGSSAPEPAVSSGSELIDVPTPAKTASVEKDTTKLKDSETGSPTLPQEILPGKIEQPAKA